MRYPASRLSPTWIAVLALLAGCAQPPRDPAGTTERIERSGKIVVGYVAGAPRSSDADGVLTSVAARFGARIERRPGHGEDLLHRLERAELDIVYGAFAKTSPWARHVHLGTPLGRRKVVPSDERVPRFAFRNGENGWIMRVEREIAR